VGLEANKKQKDRESQEEKDARLKKEQERKQAPS